MSMIIFPIESGKLIVMAGMTHVILRLHNGDRSSSKCVSCNLCLQEGLKGSGIACVADEKTGQIDAGK